MSLYEPHIQLKSMSFFLNGLMYLKTVNSYFVIMLFHFARHAILEKNQLIDSDWLIFSASFKYKNS